VTTNNLLLIILIRLLLIGLLAPSAWRGPWPSLATWLPSEKLEALDAKRTSYPRLRNLIYHATTSSA